MSSQMMLRMRILSPILFNRALKARKVMTYGRNGMMFGRNGMIFGMILALTTLCSCSPSSSVESGVVRVQLSNEPVSLDPTFAEDGVSLQILSNTFDGLLGYDSKGRLENRLAESYSVAPDGKKLEFRIRKNAYWSDGKPIEVQDFITAFRRTLGPESTSKLASLFFPIRNAEAFHSRKVSEAELGVYEKNEKLVIELERPAPYLLQALVLSPAFPLRQDVLAAAQGRWPEEGPSTGPYRLVSHQLNQEIRLETNPFFEGNQIDPSRPRKFPIHTVRFLVVSDESTALNLFSSGKLDIMTRIPTFEFQNLKKKGLVQTRPFWATYYLAFNCRKPPFQNSEWRKAVAGAIRKDEIISLLGAGEIKAWSWIPAGLEGALPDRDSAAVFKDALTSVMKADTSVMKTDTSVVKKADGVRSAWIAGFDSGARNSSIMEKVQQDLKSNLGVEVTLNPMDWKTYVKTLQVDPPQIFRFGWMAPFHDPIPLLRVFMSQDSNNYTGCGNSRYDELVKEIESLAPGKVREGKIQAAQKILLEEEAMVIPIYHYVQNLAISRRVTGFEVSPLGSIQFRTLGLTEP